MITLIHLLQHLGLPSGVAIAVVIAGRKLIKGGLARTLGHRQPYRQPDRQPYRQPGRQPDRRSSRRYR
ncbi:MAG: hypothetical protein JO016_03255 [Actinobacteria bacterium]|nr:hypothetical protein [Actinomycetota bacterium]